MHLRLTRTFSACLGLSLLCYGALFATPKWTSLPEALKKAQAEKKRVFIDFYADWCTYCHQMDKTTLKDPKILQELEKNFISVKLNTESKKPMNWKGQSMTENEFAELMGVSSLPTLLFLNPKAESIGHFVSYADPALFLSMLQYISSGARERFVSFEDYIAKK